MQRSFSAKALVLKRVNTGEYDRILTLLTPEQGKIVAVAKGVRRLTSKQRAFLEPGNYVTIFLVKTSSLPLIIQTKLMNDFSQLKKNLKSVKKLVEILEIIDQLFPEGVDEVELFEQLVSLIHQLNESSISTQETQESLRQMLIQLGYQDIRETKYSSILAYVASVADRPLHSYDYLTVKE